MGTVTGGKSRTEKVLFGLLNGVAWVVLLFVLLAINVRRANAFEGRDANFRLGYAVGGFLLSLALAFALWFVVQHAIRKRRGYPPWIAVIAIGFSLLLAALDSVRREEAHATAPATAATAVPAECKVGARPYGDPPAGLRYAEATGADRTQALSTGDLGSREAGTDVSFALEGGDRLAVLYAVPNLHQAFLDGAEARARDLGAPRWHEKVAGHDVLFMKDANDAYLVYGLRGCVGLMLTSFERKSAETLVRAMFR